MSSEESKDKIESETKLSSEETPMSKNAKKKMLKRKRLEEKWAKIKELKKEEREAKKLKLDETVETKITDPAIKEDRKKKIAEQKRQFNETVEKSQKVIVDFGFENMMLETERKSLASQILYLYGDIKKSKIPMKLYLSDFHDDIKMRLEKMSGFNDWAVYPDPRPFQELFPKEQLIYLTADSPNTITSLDSNKVYVIGGIVDRNRYKGLTYDRATNLGIETGRLPIDDGIKLLSSKVLTVNHVGNILLTYQTEKDWKEAVLKAIPNRKLQNEDHLSKKQRRNKNIKESSEKLKNES